MTEIKRLSLVLSVVHVVGAVFALLVFAITAASIAESNKAASAVNSNTVNDLTGALSALSNQFGRKLLATRSTYYYGVSFGSFLNFTMFVSISGMLLSAFLALCYFKANIYDKTLGALAAKSPAWARWPFYELVIAAVWCIFWLAAAGAASDSPFVRVISYCTGVSSCDQVNAVVAFSWLSWLLWLAIVVLLAVEYGLAARKHRKAVAPGTTAAVAPVPAETKKDVEAPAPAPAPAAAEVHSKDAAHAPWAAVEPAAPEAVVVPGAVEEKPNEGAAEVELVSHP